ncbi:hypothetical protein BGZ83_010975 [Gryganskiella cystojenkinii]|nr:hypothetical protein BGZ83_010975 [Gryganskiella cystojenkinii]
MTFAASHLVSDESGLPEQQLRVGKDGPVVVMATEWDEDTQKFYVSAPRINDRLRVDVHYVQRKRKDGKDVTIPMMQDRENRYYEPHRYAYTPDILEVYSRPQQKQTTTDRQPQEPSEHFNQLAEQLILSIKNGNNNQAEECRKVLQQHFPEYISRQNDSTNIALVKIQDYTFFPVPRRFYVVMLRQKSAISRILQALDLFTYLQLHLLCECGIYKLSHNPAKSPQLESPMTDQQLAFEPFDDEDNGAISNAIRIPRVHLSNHPGYKVKKPTQFCQDFGPYLLAVMKFLRAGAILAGIIVPPLAPFLPASVTAFQTAVNYNSQSWSEPWQNTITYIAKHCKSTMELEENELAEIREPKPLEGPEFRKFKVLLEKMDPANEFGNLIPTFCNLTGRLKWVCKDHCETTEYGRRELDHLEAVVRRMSNVSAKLNRATGELFFKLLSDSAAMKDLYDALIVAPGIKHVMIELGTSLSEVAFRVLMKQLTRANASHISLNGRQLKASEVWFNSIVKLMVNKRCQCLRLVQFPDFFKHISMAEATFLQPTYGLEILEIDSRFTPSKDMHTLQALLRLCPALQILILSTDYTWELMREIRQPASRLCCLKAVMPENTTVVKFLDGQTEPATIKVRVYKSTCLPLSAATHSHLTTFRLYQELEDDDVSSLHTPLADLIKSSPLLNTFDFRIPLKHIQKLLDILGSVLDSTIKSKNLPSDRLHSTSSTGTASGLITKRTVRVRSLSSIHEHEVSMVVQYQGAVIFDSEVNVTMSRTTAGMNDLQGIFRNHGLSIQSLGANHLMSDDLMDALFKAVKREGSKLKTLTLDPAGLTNPFNLQQLLKHCGSLIDFTLSFSSLDQISWQQQASKYIYLFAERITRLILQGENLSDWILEIGQYRQELSSLRHLIFDLANDDRTNGFEVLDEFAVDGLAFMTSKPDESRSLLRPWSSFSSSPGFLSLETFVLSHVYLSEAHWESLLSNLDLQELRHLGLKNTNFGPEQMRLLIQLLSEPTLNPAVMLDDKRQSPLRELDIRGTTLVCTKERTRRGQDELDQLETELLLRVPSIRVIIE